MTPKLALELTFTDYDTGEETTIKEYFKLLLQTLWYERDSFSGKHPFGNSGWESCLQKPLVGAGCIAGTLDIYEDGWEVSGVDDDEYAAYIELMIDVL